MSLTCRVQIRLDNISKKKADAVRKALEPDNINFPKELSLEIENTNKGLIFNFESYDDMKKLIGTVDEVLEHIQVSLGVMKQDA